MGTHTIAVTDESFEQDVMKASVPVLVDFWAEWCGPCKMIAPALEEIASELNGKLVVAKIDIDSNPEIATRLGIRSIPTLALFKDGKAVAHQTGALPKSKLKAWIEQYLLQA